MRKREIMGRDPFEFEYPVPRCLIDLTQTHAPLVDRNPEDEFVHQMLPEPLCNEPIKMKKFSPVEIFR